MVQPGTAGAEQNFHAIAAVGCAMFLGTRTESRETGICAPPACIQVAWRGKQGCLQCRRDEPNPGCGRGQQMEYMGTRRLEVTGTRWTRRWGLGTREENWGGDTETQWSEEKTKIGQETK